MQAKTLKSKYPELWGAVETQVKEDINCKSDFTTIAHNAAFVACSEHHKSMKAVKARKP